MKEMGLNEMRAESSGGKRSEEVARGSLKG
jgi:hypothetical protein